MVVKNIAAKRCHEIKKIVNMRKDKMHFMKREKKIRNWQTKKDTGCLSFDFFICQLVKTNSNQDKEDSGFQSMKNGIS